MSSRRPGLPLADRPSASDRFVRSLSARIGGPFGRHGQPGTSLWNATRVALVTATVVYVAGVLFRLPCRMTVAGQVPDVYKNLCYSDIGVLYGLRGLLEGNTPYLDSGAYQVLEYPVLTGMYMYGAAQITAGWQWLHDHWGFPSALDVVVFFVVCALGLALFWLVTIWATALVAGVRVCSAAIAAVSPLVIVHAFTNFDALAAALATTGLLAWSRRRPWLAGVLIGLGGAAKFYPLLLLGPLLMLCLRAGRLREGGRARRYTRRDTRS